MELIDLPLDDATFLCDIDWITVQAIATDLDLIVDLEKRGQMDPVVLNKTPHGYIVIHGVRRIRCLKALKKLWVKAFVYDNISPQDMRRLRGSSMDTFRR